MATLLRPRIALTLGAALTAAMAFVGGRASGPALAEELSHRAQAAIAEAGGAGEVTASLISAGGWPTRHPVLLGGEKLTDAERNRIAKAVAGVPGIGGVRWEDSSTLVDRSVVQLRPHHCQDDVRDLLRARTIRFEESSANIDRASGELVDEVAQALRPCLGSIIAITGHTDSSGTEPGNLALSQERADAVRDALIARGIPADGLRSRGVGSSLPVEGLAPEDPANRRIEFTVVATEPLMPTPVDTPGPR